MKNNFIIIYISNFVPKYFNLQKKILMVLYPYLAIKDLWVSVATKDYHRKWKILN